MTPAAKLYRRRTEDFVHEKRRQEVGKSIDRLTWRYRGLQTDAKESFGVQATQGVIFCGLSLDITREKSRLFPLGGWSRSAWSESSATGGDQLGAMATRLLPP